MLVLLNVSLVDVLFLAHHASCWGVGILQSFSGDCYEMFLCPFMVLIDIPKRMDNLCALAH